MAIWILIGNDGSFDEIPCIFTESQWRPLQENQSPTREKSQRDYIFIEKCDGAGYDPNGVKYLFHKNGYKYGNPSDSLNPSCLPSVVIPFSRNSNPHKPHKG